jgi:hypothetical protein
MAGLDANLAIDNSPVESSGSSDVSSTHSSLDHHHLQLEARRARNEKQETFRTYAKEPITHIAEFAPQLPMPVSEISPQHHNQLQFDAVAYPGVYQSQVPASEMYFSGPRHHNVQVPHLPPQMPAAQMPAYQRFNHPSPPVTQAPQKPSKKKRASAFIIGRRSSSVAAH